MAGSTFAAEFATAFADVECVHGEGFLLTPMRRNVDRNAAAIPDTDRAPIEIIGVWHDGVANPAIVNAYDPRTDQRPGTIAGKPRVDFGPGRIPAGVSLRAGDLLTRLSDGRVWRIDGVLLSRQRITRCDVNIIG